jgi:hypothetical protein
MFKNLFSKKRPEITKQFEELEKSKQALSDTLDNSMELVIEDINSTRQFFEKMRNHGIRRFDNLLTVCLQSSIVNADLMLLTERIRLSKRPFEKPLYARMAALTLIEYLKDINTYLGYDLIGELNKNNYKELIPTIKEINKQFADIRKKHEQLLTTIRNNISAHKTKDALNLVHYIFSLDPDEIFNLSLEVIQTNTKLSDTVTKVYYKMIDEANEKKQNSR